MAYLNQRDLVIWLPVRFVTSANMKYAIILAAIVCLALVLPNTEALPTTTVGQSPTRVTVKGSNDSNEDKSGDSKDDDEETTSPRPRPPPPGVSGMPTGISGQI